MISRGVRAIGPAYTEIVNFLIERPTDNNLTYFCLLAPTDWQLAMLYLTLGANDDY